MIDILEVFTRLVVRTIQKGVPRMENMEQKAGELKKKRAYTLKTRAITYSVNPFMTDSYPMVKSRTKRITNNRGELMIKSETGEVVSQIAGFWKAEEVDSTKFIKLYVNGVKAFSNLSSKGTKVFELMYYEMQNEIGKDKIYLNFLTIDVNIKLSKSSFYDGISELVEKRFLAPVKNNTHWFFINPDYVFNGDRLTFARTYVKADSNSGKIDTKTLDLFAIENKPID